MTRRIHIDRLELDLRGIPPAAADRAARMVGTALARALEGRGSAVITQRHLDAGRIESRAGAEPSVAPEAARAGR